LAEDVRISTVELVDRTDAQLALPVVLISSDTRPVVCHTVNLGDSRTETRFSDGQDSFLV
jgi:hypothetical protein